MHSGLCSVGTHQLQAMPHKETSSKLHSNASQTHATHIHRAYISYLYRYTHHWAVCWHGDAMSAATLPAVYPPPMARCINPKAELWTQTDTQVGALTLTDIPSHSPQNRLSDSTIASHCTLDLKPKTLLAKPIHPGGCIQCHGAAVAWVYVGSCTCAGAGQHVHCALRKEWASCGSKTVLRNKKKLRPQSCNCTCQAHPGYAKRRALQG